MGDFSKPTQLTRGEAEREGMTTCMVNIFKKIFEVIFLSYLRERGRVEEYMVLYAVFFFL